MTDSQNQEAAAAPAHKPGRFQQFLERRGISVTALPEAAGVETLAIETGDLTQVMELLRDSPETELDFLVCVSGVEMEETFDSVYHLWSYQRADELVIKACLPKANLTEAALPVVPSLAGVWPAANWHEREAYDLLGIRYIGHPYLRRILNPWDWEGYPLRRDYRQPVDALNDKSPGSMR